MALVKILTLTRLWIAFFFCGLIVLAYWSGLHRGKVEGYRSAERIIRSGAFVASFDTLQRLEAGDSTNAAQRLEDYCYSTAADLLELPSPSSNVVNTLFKESLTRYLKTHPRLPAEQTPTQLRLERLLSIPAKGSTNVAKS